MWCQQESILNISLKLHSAHLSTHLSSTSTSTRNRHYSAKIRFPKTLQKLPVSICQHLNITNVLCQGERSGPVTKHRGTSQWRTVREGLDQLHSYDLCQAPIHLSLTSLPLKDCLSAWGQECDWSNCVSQWESSAAISLNVSLPNWQHSEITCDQIRPFLLDEVKGEVVTLSGGWFDSELPDTSRP